jgi:predicted enzyme related to lactoylglutathione lyase
MPITGPDFISLQVRDLERSAAFYDALGFARAPFSPPHAIVFSAGAAAFAVRDVLPGVDLDALEQPGKGIALWMHATGVQQIHDELVAAGTVIVSAPADGPFGLTFTFADPDGYHVTLHDRA